METTYVFNIKPESVKLKHTNSPVKKKFPAQQLVKKVMLTDFVNMKGPMVSHIL